MRKPHFPCKRSKLHYGYFFTKKVYFQIFIIITKFFYSYFKINIIFNQFPNEIKLVKITENLEIDHYYKLLSETIFEMPIYDSECPRLFQNYNNSEELLADQLFQQISISIISLKDFEKVYETYLFQVN